MTKPLLPIHTAADFTKVLALQEAIVRATKSTIVALAMEHREPGAFFAAAKKLIEVNATYPTFSEFRDKPSLTNVYKWGATFSIPVLMTALVLQTVQTQYPKFEPVVRRIFLLLLTELDSPEHPGDFIVYLHSQLSMRVSNETKESVAYVPNAGSVLYEVMHADLVKVVSMFIMVGYSLGLMSEAKESTSLTPVGQRVLLHLIDAAKCIEEASAAQVKFKRKKN